MPEFRFRQKVEWLTDDRTQPKPRRSTGPGGAFWDVSVTFSGVELSGLEPPTGFFPVHVTDNGTDLFGVNAVHMPVHFLGSWAVTTP